MKQVKFNGSVYTLTQDAYYSNGNTEEYMAGALDADGNDCIVYWAIRDDIDSETAEEDEMCNWDEPSRVEIHYTYDEDTILDMIREKAKESGNDYDYFLQFTKIESEKIKEAYTESDQELIRDGIEDLKRKMDRLEEGYNQCKDSEGKEK